MKVNGESEGRLAAADTFRQFCSLPRACRLRCGRQDVFYGHIGPTCRRRISHQRLGGAPQSNFFFGRSPVRVSCWSYLAEPTLQRDSLSKRASQTPAGGSRGGFGGRLELFSHQLASNSTGFGRYVMSGTSVSKVLMMGNTSGALTDRLEAIPSVAGRTLLEIRGQVAI